MADPKNKLTRVAIRSLADLPAKQRLDALLDFPDAKAAVRRASPEDLYVAIAEVGLDDATEIVQLASPAQFRTFVDLAGWRKDRLVPTEILSWLRAARGDEPEEFIAKLQKLDLEILEYLLRELAIIHDLEETPDVDVEGVTFESPEGKYLIEFRVEGTHLAALRQLVHDLVAADPFGAGRLFEAIRWEVPSELEETAYQFRSARLQDLGFPELYDALSIFAFTDPDKLAPAAPPATERGELAAAAPPSGLLEACFADLTDEERPDYEEQLRLLVNSALVAEGAEPGDLDAIRRVSELARDYLALGLEHVSGGMPQFAADAVRRLGFKRVFQAGFSLTLRLKFRADRLARTPGFWVDKIPLLLGEEAKVFAAVRRKRPLRALKVEGAEPVPFRNQREIAEIAAVLERAEHQQAVLRAVLGDDAQLRAAWRDGGEALEIDVLWMSAVARTALGLEPPCGRVPEDRLSDLGAALVAPATRGAVADRLSPKVAPEHRPELARIVGWAMDRLRDELGAGFGRDGRLDRQAAEALLVL